MALMPVPILINKYVDLTAAPQVKRPKYDCQPEPRFNHFTKRFPKNCPNYTCKSIIKSGLFEEVHTVVLFKNVSEMFSGSDRIGALVFKSAQLGCKFEPESSLKLTLV